jgi:hypothetical protein
LTQITNDDDKLRSIYHKTVEQPNKSVAKKGFIRCPECGEEILMIPTLRIMNVAIENHVLIHKEQLKANPITQHQTAIFIRLSLMDQVLKYTYRTQVV